MTGWEVSLLLGGFGSWHKIEIIIGVYHRLAQARFRTGHIQHLVVVPALVMMHMAPL